jgi:hypothetical protein
VYKSLKIKKRTLIPLWKILLQHSLIEAPKWKWFRVFWNVYILGIWDFYKVEKVEKDGELPLKEICALFLIQKNKKFKRISLIHYRINTHKPDMLEEVIPAFFNQLFLQYYREGYEHFRVYVPDNKTTYIYYFEELGFNVSQNDTFILSFEKIISEDITILYKSLINE